jgi:predicted transcriptional regulator
MPAAFRGMLERDRVRLGLRVGQVAWRLGISVREYRELVEGEAWPSYEVWERIEEFSGWPQTFVTGART